jgi:hypothetical protein
LRGGQFQLGVEGTAAVGRQLVQIDVADVELGLQGLSEGIPVGMPGQSGQGAPDMAVKELLACGTTTGVVVTATAFDLGAVTRRGCIVDGHGQTPGVQQWLDSGPRAEGHGTGLAADGADGGVTVAELIGNAGSAEPGRDGAAAFGEEDTVQQEGQTGGTATIEPMGQVQKCPSDQGGQAEQ